MLKVEKQIEQWILENPDKTVEILRTLNDAEVLTTISEEDCNSYDDLEFSSTIIASEFLALYDSDELLKYLDETEDEISYLIGILKKYDDESFNDSYDDYNYNEDYCESH